MSCWTNYYQLLPFETTKQNFLMDINESLIDIDKEVGRVSSRYSKEYLLHTKKKLNAIKNDITKSNKWTSSYIHYEYDCAFLEKIDNPLIKRGCYSNIGSPPFRYQHYSFAITSISQWYSLIDNDEWWKSKYLSIDYGNKTKKNRERIKKEVADMFSSKVGLIIYCC